MYMQIRSNVQKLPEIALPVALSSAVPLSFPPLEIRNVLQSSGSADLGMDAILQMAYGGSEHTFLVEYKRDNSQRAFQGAVEQITRTVARWPAREVYPLVVLPYLSEDHLRELESRHVSGIDLCGNGLVTVPGQWLLWRSGQPNRFQKSADSAGVNPFRGRASLAPRTLLRRSRFRRLEDLHSEIGRRGGSVSLALVSRAVKSLKAELILVSEPGMRVRLIQPEKLLDRLVMAFKSPDLAQPAVCRVALQTREILPRLFHAADAHGVRIAMTGVGSASRYAPVTLDDVVRVYADQVDPLLLDLPIKPGERFANLEIHVPRDPLPYFDTERDEQGVVWASPVQTCLEMMYAGDARLHEGAQHIRTKILSELEGQGDET